MWQLLGAAGFVLVYLPLWYRGAAPSLGRRSFLWCIAIGLAFVASAVVRIYRREALPERLLLNRRGLAFHPPSFGITVLPWSEIERAKCSWVDGTLQVITPDDRTLLRCSYRKLGALRIAKQCATEINDALRRYKSVPRDDTRQNITPTTTV